ncbi:MAG: VWA domain-containing protein [Bryobacteraceae bacterium]|nr:VWA domain-containing protein [Bryobacteraceae bacterium]
MTFERVWILPLALAPLIWAAWTWMRAALDGKQRIGLVLKALSLAAILVALAEPRLRVNETKVAVAVLADTSASVSGADLKKASEIADRLESASGRHWMRVIPFARTTRDAQASERAGSSWKLAATAGEAGRATDLEAAIREASAALPEAMVPRIALISDGRENQGSVARAAWQAKELGIPVDVYSLAGRPKPSLRLDAVSLPETTFTGERFAIELRVSSPRKASGELEIVVEGKPLAASPISLEAGSNVVRAQAALNVSGAVALSGTLRAGDLGEVRFTRALALRRPKLLFVSQDPEGTDVHLMRTVEAGQFEVRKTASFDERLLAGSQVAVMNNQDLEALPEASKLAIERYVKAGGGMVVIGGERNVYVEKKPGTPEDPLERTLPAKLAPPRSPEGTCVVLIVDKSSSMEGRKMELARLAAIGVIENLRPVDLVGVLIFDNSFQWAVPIRKAEDRQLIKRLVAGITPDGGTQIAPALSEAFRRAVPTKATFKHIVLLTDGISEEGDSISVAREAALQKITISTVGLGQDVNRAYLDRIATLSKGKAYFLNDPSGLEQILLRDVMEHTGSTAIEKPIVPIVSKQVELLDGLDLAKAPALRGYVKFAAKPTAESILTVPGQTPDQRDPLLVRWQYGLGRAAIFTSDAKARWAEAWVAWPGFDRFWANVLRDLLPHAQAGEARAELDPATGDLVVEYRLAASIEEPQTIPGIYVFGPDGFQQPVPVEKIAAGAYRGRVALGGRQGLFRVRPLAESAAFPETGFYRDERELSDYGTNEPLLRELASFTGGRFNPEPRQVFEAGGRGVESALELWPGLLALAIALNVAELMLRKWAGLPWARKAIA